MKNLIFLFAFGFILSCSTFASSNPPSPNEDAQYSLLMPDMVTAEVSIYVSIENGIDVPAIPTNADSYCLTPNEITISNFLGNYVTNYNVYKEPLHPTLVCTTLAEPPSKKNGNVLKFRPLLC